MELRIRMTRTNPSLNRAPQSLQFYMLEVTEKSNSKTNITYTQTYKSKKHR